MKTDENDYKDRIFCCDHIVEEGEAEHVFIWAGKHTRIRLCKFCSNVAMGTIIQRTVGDAARQENPGLTLEKFVPYARQT